VQQLLFFSKKMSLSFINRQN